MPNFVKLDPKPFHPDTYSGPDLAADGVSEREKSMSIKLEVENTIRWRWSKSGKDVADESTPQVSVITPIKLHLTDYVKRSHSLIAE